jgi:hypothetical protein
MKHLHNLSSIIRFVICDILNFKSLLDMSKISTKFLLQIIRMIFNNNFVEIFERSQLVDLMKILKIFK